MVEQEKEWAVFLSLYSLAERQGQAAGAACKTFMPRETRKAAPVSFSRGLDCRRHRIR